MVLLATACFRPVNIFLVTWHRNDIAHVIRVIGVPLTAYWTPVVDAEQTLKLSETEDS